MRRRIAIEAVVMAFLLCVACCALVVIDGGRQLATLEAVE